MHPEDLINLILERLPQKTNNTNASWLGNSTDDTYSHGVEVGRNEAIDEVAAVLNALKENGLI
jgi:hypothetical protein